MKTKPVCPHGLLRIAVAKIRTTRIIAPLLAASVFLSAIATQAQTYSLTGVWYAPTNAVSSTNIIQGSGDNNRGLAYDAISNQVFVVAKGGGAPAPTIQVLNGSTGSFVGMMDTTGVSGGTFALNQVKVADDGVIYSANLQTATAINRLYRWSSWNNVPSVAYSGIANSNNLTGFVAAGGRIGDAMAIRGAGTNTQIVMPILNGTTLTTNMVIFTTVDGTNFNPHIIGISGYTPSGSGICGITFYTNNTFMFRSSGSAANNLILVQFPANIASLDEGPVPASQLGSFALPSVVSTTAHIDYKATTQGGLMALASPQNAGGVSAVGQVALYLDPVLGNGACPILQTTTNYPHLNANGNLAGAAVLGGATFTEFIYSLDCNNGVRCSAITTISPQAPSISTQPTGVTGFAPYTLSVAAAGFCPLAYQWQASTNGTTNFATFTNIPSATSSSYAVSNPSTNYYRVIITNSVNPAVTSSVVLVSLRASLSNAAVSQLWRVVAGAAGYTAFLNADNNGRGIAYDTNLQKVAVSYVNSAAVYILDANTGATNGNLSVTGLATGSGATFNIDQVGVADDGAVYTCNLAVAPSGVQNPVVINRWNTLTNGATPLSGGAYSGAPGGIGERYGDNMAVRGRGTNTQILIASSSAAITGVGPATNILLFTTSNGTNFTPTVIGVAGVPSGFAGAGIAFGDGNSFWAKSANGNLFKISFDPVSGANTILFDYSAVPATTMGLAVDPVLSLMATIVQGNSPDDVQLFQLTGNAAPPVLFHQGLMSNNANANANGAIVMKNKRLYALDVNNGILALSYDVPIATPPSISTPPASVTAYTNAAAYFSVVASGTLTLNYQWRSNGIAIPGATSTTYVFPNPPLSASGATYDVVVQNTAGSITSTPPAVLTVKAPTLSPVVTNKWTMAPGSNPNIPTLDESTYNLRGLAYDAVSGRLLVADHFNIYAIDPTTQNYIENLNTAGLPDVGLSSWTIGQIRIADDGAVYSCNIQDTVFRPNTLCLIRWSSADSGAALNYAWGDTTGADPTGFSDRVGDTMAIRGAGLDTQILMGTANASRVVLFRTVDGTTFTPTVITVTNAPAGFASGGISFGSGTNTFWAKGDTGFNLRQVTFDVNNPGTAAVTRSYLSGSEVPSTLVGLAVDTTRNLLAGVNIDNTPDDLQLFLLSGNATPPALVHQAFFPAVNANAQHLAAVDIKYPWVFGLDVNNGIVALNYGVPSAPGAVISGVTYSPGSVTLNCSNCFNGATYQAAYKNVLTDPSWTPVGLSATATNSTVTLIDNTAVGATRFYRVITQ